MIDIFIGPTKSFSTRGKQEDDEVSNQLDPLIVQKLVKKKWWKLILKKGLSYLNG